MGKRSASDRTGLIPCRPHAITTGTRETVLRLTVQHDDARALRFFLMEIAPVSDSVRV